MSARNADNLFWTRPGLPGRSAARHCVYLILSGPDPASLARLICARLRLHYKQPQICADRPSQIYLLAVMQPGFFFASRDAPGAAVAYVAAVVPYRTTTPPVDMGR